MKTLPAVLLCLLASPVLAQDGALDIGPLSDASMPPQQATAPAYEEEVVPSSPEAGGPATLTVTPQPLELRWYRKDGKDVQLISQLMQANQAQSILEMFLRITGIVEQQGQQIKALSEELVTQSARLRGMEARLSVLEGQK